MKKILLFILIGAILVLGVVGYLALKSKAPVKISKPAKLKEIAMPEKVLENKKIAIVITFREFRDVEYFIPRNDLEKAGAKILTVSSQKGTAIGADGGEVEVDLSLSEFKAENFDAVVFVGGPGMAKKLDDENFQNIAKIAAAANKVLGAICISPALLAKAGILQGKKATVWSSPLDRSPIRMLKEGGAEYLAQDVVVDGKIVTANGPGAAREFAQKLIQVLK